MTTDNYYITADCAICNGSITSQGREVLSTGRDMPAADFLEEAYRRLEIGYSKFFKMDRLSKLGILAAEVLLAQGFDMTKYAPEHIGVVLGNTNASLDADIRYYESVKNIPSPALFVYTLPNIVIGEISIRHQLKGENAFFIAEGFDASLLHFYVTDLMRHHQVDCCIAGRVEIVGEAYEAILWLVEKEPGNKEPVAFTIETLNKLYAIAHG